ncbi:MULTISPECIES: glycosyltransferase family 4 protein [unclassified Marinomonas]|uniref:glycosyltransferase family 4 protein n=1 Tax=unclassified Marinomonas TaxID=196814 RepID=UPI0018D42DB2|nr:MULTISPECIES: glycosyltransferase family 4 protein [unclassified Marinomonas]
MKNNKVLVFSHELPPLGGGAGVVGLQYCNELYQAGFNVTLLTKKEKSYPNSLKNIRIIGAEYIPKVYLLPYVFALMKVKLNDYDYIILNDMVAAYVAGFYFSEEDLSKSTLILHGSEPEIIYDSPDIYQRITLLKFFYNKALNKVGKIIAVSNYMKSKILNETPFNDAKKIFVHYSKLGSPFFPLSNKPTKIEKTKNKEVILTVSRIEKGKGFLEMYEIFKKLISLDNTFQWTIVGDGSFKSALVNLINKDKMNEYIKFVGKIDRNDLIYQYNNADVFWLLSNYKESFGLVYLEAQACYCPAVGYKKYGVIETINNNKTGFLVENKEQCLDIFINREYKYFKKSDFKEFINALHLSSIKAIL